VNSLNTRSVLAGLGSSVSELVYLFMLISFIFCFVNHLSSLEIEGAGLCCQVLMFSSIPPTIISSQHNG
jgi:hypothetical protein